MSQSPLLTITLELKLSIISFLPLSDKRRLRLTCQMFNNLLALDVPHEQLQVAERKQTILLIDGANEGEPGHESFFICNVRKVETSGSDDTAAAPDAAPNPASDFHLTQDYEKQLLFDVYHPMFMCDESEISDDEDEWVIRISMRELQLEEVKSVNYKSSVEVAGMCARGVEGSASDSHRYFLVVAKDFEDSEKDMEELWDDINEMLEEENDR
ncbi:hypothetical protein BDP27DRAFT_1366492 [Rhodocollybia butyracea]|uniref:F-box domain-containing protein n=1 Tax=Rhodocollybia butyracea TaxID=206335 RepID=A0A9P5PMS5_9AGAR|nr:hypothetical protein BDP27DRAFT_1366492 [Rhodocollybia butyracea]